MLKFCDLNEFPKNLITEENKIITRSERKVVDNFYTIWHNSTIATDYGIMIIVSR